MAIKHIFFDIDDTLFPTSEFAELARKNALRGMMEVGLEKDIETLYKTLLKVITKYGSNYDKHFDYLCRELGIKHNRAKYVAAAIAAYHNTKSAILPYPEIPRILLKLREQGYILHIATNGNSIKQWDKLIRLGIVLYFENVFVSEELKVEKSTKFFESVLKKINATPEECLIIGDKEDSDIIPAKRVGFKTFRLRRGKYSSGKTIADFEAKDLNGIFDILQSLG